MATQVLVFVVAAVAGVAAAAGPSNADIIGYVRYVHNGFLRVENVSAPYDYSYAYEFYDWETQLTQGQYEERHGDLAVGRYYRVMPEGERTTVDYTVDTRHGIRASVRRDVLRHPVALARGCLNGPLTYGYPTVPKTLLDEESLKTASHHARYAYRAHNGFRDFFVLEAPYKLCFGFQIADAHTGRVRSQYETYQGMEGAGRFTTLEADGTKIGVDYALDSEGFSASAPLLF